MSPVPEGVCVCVFDSGELYRIAKTVDMSVFRESAKRVQKFVVRKGAEVRAKEGVKWRNLFCLETTSEFGCFESVFPVTNLSPPLEDARPSDRSPGSKNSATLPTLPPTSSAHPKPPLR